MGWIAQPEAPVTEEGVPAGSPHINRPAGQEGGDLRGAVAGKGAAHQRGGPGNVRRGRRRAVELLARGRAIGDRVNIGKRRQIRFDQAAVERAARAIGWPFRAVRLLGEGAARIQRGHGDRPGRVGEVAQAPRGNVQT